MDYLPKDPAILVSSVNMLLRDEEFDTLESLCYAFSREPKEIKDWLRSMITKDSIETAYSFLHQKRNVYIHSSLDWQKDDIEYAIASYADDMSRELYDAISGGRADFLRDHKRFPEDITQAVERLENML